jgi:hypothetical protein
VPTLFAWHNIANKTGTWLLPPFPSHASTKHQHDDCRILPQIVLASCKSTHVPRSACLLICRGFTLPLQTQMARQSGSWWKKHGKPTTACVPPARALQDSRWDKTVLHQHVLHHASCIKHPASCGSTAGSWPPTRHMSRMHPLPLPSLSTTAVRRSNDG